MMSTQFQARVKVFLTHNGGEYVNNTLAYFFHAQGVRGSELESLEVENLGLELENDVFEDTVLGKERTDRTEARDRSPISEDETCDLCEETTGRPLELDRLPISGDEVNALGVETTNCTEASDRSPVSKKSVVSRSSAEAEYRGMAQGVCELLWLRKLLGDLGCASQKPMDLYCDNKAAIAIAHNHVQHDRTKHVEVD
ncbi:unnamed protein product [Prunus brigantina]